MLSDSSTAYDRLVEVNFTVSDFQIEFTLGVGANPLPCSALPHPAHRNQIKEPDDLRRSSYTWASYSNPKLITLHNSITSISTSRITPNITVRTQKFVRSVQILEESKLDHAAKY